MGYRIYHSWQTTQRRCKWVLESTSSAFKAWKCNHGAAYRARPWELSKWWAYPNDSYSWAMCSPALRTHRSSSSNC